MSNGDSRGIEMDFATVHEEIDSFFESTSPFKDSAKIINKLNQFIQFDSSSGEGKGRRVEELLK
ncbi:Phosphopantothenate--cysteine ligase 1 -like protein [Gossypium arboreum]|uniref:Phosphopantothenate--cysteine ligase 1-like protein n=1 Tax=Gossypium arboreum TaxID=29729 RepID=A0A0B0NXR0_GOSAR|nr:Phosphopantothenate--cysteine ligase 1 -like protein [Gossypium arboreum]